METCAPLGHADKPKAWSKHSAESSAFKRENRAKEDQAEVDEAEKEQQEKEKRRNKKKEKNKEIQELLEEHQDDPMFAEFLKVHDNEKQLWDNDVGYGEEKKEHITGERSSKADDEGHSDNDGDNTAEGDDGEKVANEQEVSDMDYLKMLQKKPIEKKSSVSKASTTSKSASVDFFTIKIFDLPYKAKRQDVMKFFKPLKPKSVRIPITGRGYCYVGFKDEKEFKKAMFKNKSFMNGKQIHMVDFTEDNRKTLKMKLGLAVEGDAEQEKDAKRAKWARQEDALRNEEGIGESGSIFFRNLTYSVTEESLQQLFEKYGPIAEINLPIDISSRKIKGFGTVTFVMPEHALMAYNDLDGHIFQGRMLHLLPGKKEKDKEGELDDDDELNSLSFKQKKAKKLKQAAGSSHNWNTLFMGANAVAEVIAKQFGTDKERVLDAGVGGGKGAAVRLALGETQVVAEMKEFLEENGVRLAAFEGVIKKRSKTIILVKNLPANTERKELYPLFGKFGVIAKLVLPPSGVAALVQFVEPSEAKKAFQGLAYSKFKTVPLYLEWAPENAIKEGGAKEEGDEEVQQSVDRKEQVDRSKEEEKMMRAREVEQEKVEEKEEVDDTPPEPDTTIFLRNLNYITVEKTVTNHFGHLGAIHMVQVARKKNPKDPSEKISLGYGFIQFKLRSTAEQALKSMQFTMIDNNKVELKKSDRTLKSDAVVQQNGHPRDHANTNAVKQTGSKLMVRNIPFQAKESEVRELFTAFGQLKSVRLPQKLGEGTTAHRGFGFVDFLSKTDAKNAFEAMQMSTHLYGRRLVLEWAAEDAPQDVQQIRKRTADTFVAATTKRSRKGVFDASQVDEAKEEDE